ncbi:MAG: restriction endonuclease [Chloroflexi bacterium]|nr:restriction endonuclease [Chloroflexota bacterium]
MTLWVVRGGSHGQYEDRFVEQSIVGLGWGEMPDLLTFETREAMRSAFQLAEPDASAGRVGVIVGQLWAFAHSMEPGDLVVSPLKTRNQVAVGHVDGPYSYAVGSGPDDLHHIRQVRWLRTDLPRTAFDPDLLSAFSALMGLFTVQRDDAEARVIAVANGAPPRRVPPESHPERDLEQEGRDQIVQLIRRRFKGHGLARIVDAILQAKGYATRVSPPGPDGGVDILAGAPPLGFGEPRIVVQVKSTDGPADVTVLRTLKGSMTDFRADQGLVVSWGGFKDSLEREARNDYFKIRLWNQSTLLNELFETYDLLGAELRAELPLKRAWMVAGEDVTEAEG